MIKTKLKHVLVSAILMVAIWEAARLISNSTSFPTIFSVLGRAAQEFVTTAFLLQLAQTLLLALFGLIIGILLAYVVGYLVAESDFFDRSSRPTLNYIRSVPSVILLPLFLVVMGPSSQATVALVAFVIFTKLVVFVIDGLRSTTKGLKDLGKTSGWNRVNEFLIVKLPSSAVFVLSGLQISASRAYGTVILCGLLIGGPGIGTALSQANDNADFEGIFAYGLIVSVIGVVVFGALARFESFLKQNWGQAR